MSPFKPYLMSFRKYTTERSFDVSYGMKRNTGMISGIKVVDLTKRVFQLPDRVSGHLENG